MTNTAPLVSVIIPIYNTAKYLPQCLDSVVNQTYRNLEIICFIDASPDNSLEIVQKYAAKDDRFVVINSLTNVKQGGGRNRGLVQSKADWVVFLDSDDWLDENYVMDLMTAAQQNSADIAFCDYYLNINGKCEAISPLGDCSGLDTEAYRKRIAGTGVSFCYAIYRKSLFFENELLFPENKFYEDNAVTKPLQLCGTRYAKVNKPLYYYRIHQKSTSRLSNNMNFYDRISTALMFRDNCIRLNFLEKYPDELNHSFLNLYFSGTVMGSYANFKPVHYDKISGVNKFVLKEYGWKRTLSFIRKKTIIERLTLTASLINPRLGGLIYKALKKASDIKHRK